MRTWADAFALPAASSCSRRSKGARHEGKPRHARMSPFRPDESILDDSWPERSRYTDDGEGKAGNFVPRPRIRGHGPFRSKLAQVPICRRGDMVIHNLTASTRARPFQGLPFRPAFASWGIVDGHPGHADRGSTDELYYTMGAEQSACHR